METLLIVEDEKMIRRGISVMASRSQVKIENIIECRNGLEALEILKKQRVDTVFTDIRMPKMDGIALVKEIAKLKQKPDVVAISGYDDFNYAVEMLKNGVFDYILKPVKREVIEEILIKLEEKQKSGQKVREINEQMLCTQVRHFLTGGLKEEEEQALKQQWEICFQGLPFTVIVGPGSCQMKIPKETGICVDHVEGQNVYFIRQEYFQVWREESGVRFAGGNGITSSLEGCKEGYLHALAARSEAFVKAREWVEYTPKLEREQDLSWEKECQKTAEQFVQKYFSRDRDLEMKNLKNLYFQGKHGEWAYWEVLDITRAILKRVREVYEKVLAEEKRSLLSYENPLMYDTLEGYSQVLEGWLEQIYNSLQEQFQAGQNKGKIMEALTYIHENYTSDLNMAMVSNYVSMNYSLFSIAFKEHTGVNFVNYLKGIRMKEAKRLLADTDLQIQEIAHRTGYENDKHFLKTFKAVCGVSPSEYRKGVRQK